MRIYRVLGRINSTIILIRNTKLVQVIVKAPIIELLTLSGYREF